MVICVTLTVPEEVSAELTRFEVFHYPEYTVEHNCRLAYTVTDACTVKVTKDGAAWKELNTSRAGDWAYQFTLPTGIYELCGSVI